MTQADIYYRALLAYKSETDGQRLCARDTNALAGAEGTENLKATRCECTVDEEWIKAIEEGLVFVEKAIKEERQFIYSNGEVIPIEKVKHVSKDSVEHLARHAQLITREQTGKDLVPDKLYTVERVNDYTVYENRFLYMLLCYLRDFVTLRYQKIVEITTAYDGRLAVQKQLTAANRTLNISIDMHDERRDDVYLREHNPARSLIDRMDLILKTILAFLATPLMESAGKAPMLKPPITKTNVLKMDNNFKGAVKLYEYIISYSGAGYTVEEKINDISPFSGALAAEMADAELLLSFLAYKHGLDIAGDLKAEYELECEKRRQKELRARAEQLDALKRRLAANGEAPEEYILQLEGHVRSLQKELDKLDTLFEELTELRHSENTLSAKVGELGLQLENATEECKELKIEHASEIKALEQAHQRELGELNSAHNAQLAALEERCEQEKQELKRENAEALEALKAQFRVERSELEESNRRQNEAASDQIQQLTESLSSLQDKYAALEEESDILKARLIGLRARGKDISRQEMDKMTEEQEFNALERELEAFVKFYKSQWSLTKRKIRKDLINMKYIKGQSTEQ